LLELFHGFLQSVPADDLVEREKDRYANIQEVHTRGRIVMARCESGFYGEEGQTFNVRTHKVAHKRGKDESATTMTRIALVLPPGGQTALFLFEKQGSASAGTRVFDLFDKKLHKAFPNHYFPQETVLEGKGWASQANLKSVTAVAHSFPVDIGSGITAQALPVGELRQSLVPTGTAKYLPFALWEALQKKKIEAAAFMGFEHADIDELIVEVEKGERSKTFAIDNEKSPSVRVMITKDNETPLTDTPFMERCMREAQDYYDGMKLSWDHQWFGAKWDSSRAAIRFPVK
jgi:hypothetical protein